MGVLRPLNKIKALVGPGGYYGVCRGLSGAYLDAIFLAIGTMSSVREARIRATITADGKVWNNTNNTDMSQTLSKNFVMTHLLNSC
jgi:hypothetical protein